MCCCQASCTYFVISVRSSDVTRHLEMTDKCDSNGTLISKSSWSIMWGKSLLCQNLFNKCVSISSLLQIYLIFFERAKKAQVSIKPIEVIILWLSKLIFSCFRQALQMWCFKRILIETQLFFFLNFHYMELFYKNSLEALAFIAEKD